MKQLVIIAHDIRSAHNVGSLLRTADGFGISMVYLTGYTPYPSLATNDSRLPHIQRNMDKLISKTALGAEHSQTWQQHDDVNTVLKALLADGFTVAALEQTPQAIPLQTFTTPDKLAVVLGREVEGISDELLAKCNPHLIIPMSGSKESFNVAQAAAVVMYHCRLIA